MQNFNYHTHTFRCGHIEKGYPDEDIVKDHIAAGYTVMAFTEHCPQKRPFDFRERARMDYAARPEYLQSISALQQKYRDQIRILSGYEIEYWHGQYDNLKELKDESDILVLGQHLVKGEDGEVKVVRKNPLSEREMENYADLVVTAIDKGLPDIIAHPDLYIGWQTSFGAAEEKVARTICKAAEKADIPLEINLNNICCHTFRQNSVVTETPIDEQLSRLPEVNYPKRPFWQIASEYDIRVLYGIDVHYRNEIAAAEGLRRLADIILGKETVQKLRFITDPFTGTSECSERVELRGIFSSDEAKNAGNTLCIPEDFCEI